MPGARTAFVGRDAGYRAAPLWLRVPAALGDAVIEASLAAGATSLLFEDLAADLPPRYWNAIDWLVDVANQRPEAIAIPAVVFAAVYVVWETLFTSLLGAAPVARVLGLRACTTSGSRPGPFRCLLRAVLSLAGTVAALTGPAVAIASPRRRMLHDILTACHVLAGEVPDAWGRRGRDAAGAAGLSQGPRLYLDGPRR
jgi:uncharacterized RDD family membrane protein YckC